MEVLLTILNSAKILCAILYKANVAAGVDYMEFGYKASRKSLRLRITASGSSAMRKI